MMWFLMREHHLFFHCVHFSESFDIGHLFLRPRVQEILKQVTGFNLNNVFHAKSATEPPTYKLLTDEELQTVSVQTVFYMLLW